MDGALKNTYSTKQTSIAINENFSRFLSLYLKYCMKLILTQFFQWIGGGERSEGLGLGFCFISRDVCEY